MIESGPTHLVPRLSFEPVQSILTVVSQPGPGLESKENSRFEAALDHIDAFRGHTIRTTGTVSTVNISIDALRKHDNGPVTDERAATVLESLATIAQFDRPSVSNTQDPLVSLTRRTGGEHITSALEAIIHPSMQRWLNNPAGMNELAARSVIQAMAQPYGQSYQTKASTSFQFQSSPTSFAARGNTSSIVSSAHIVDVYLPRSEYCSVESWPKEEPTWNLVAFKTSASATLQTNRDSYQGRNFVVTDDPDNGKPLYPLSLRKADIGRRLLSLVLGVARLATIASQEIPSNQSLHAPANNL